MAGAGAGAAIAAIHPALDGIVGLSLIRKGVVSEQRASHHRTGPLPTRVFIALAVIAAWRA